MTGSAPPLVRVVGGGGLVALVAPGGGLASLAHGDDAGVLELVQHAASAFEPGLFGVWVRDRASGRAWPALGAGSGARTAATADGFVASGGADGLRWQVTFRLHDARPAWALDVRVAVDGPREVDTRESDTREIDIVHTHDLALAAPGALRANELYVSQYLDLTPLDGPTGVALAVRQNQPQGGRHPFAVVAADREVTGWATDALAVHGLTGRRGGSPLLTAADLPSHRLQHEHTLAALQVAAARLAPGEELAVTFAGLLVPDHPAPTSADDAAVVREALALALRGGSVEVSATDPPRSGPGARALAGTAYDRGRELVVRDLTEDELRARWPAPWRLVERDGDGTLLSFFAGDEHVVTRAKELAVLRPHGTILRTGDRAAPDPDGLTVTAWMAGSPLSYLTRGHATNGRVLSTVRGYLGLHRAYGLRLFVEDAEAAGAVEDADERPGWRLLDLPSAFSMTLDGARWVYAPESRGGGGDVVEVTTHVPAQERCVALRVTLPSPRRVLVALHLAGRDDPLPFAPGAARAEATLDGVVVRLDGPAGPATLTVGASAPVTVGDDASLADDGRARAGGGVVTLVTGPVPQLELDLAVPDGVPPDAAPPVPGSAGGTLGRANWWDQVAALRVAGPDEAAVLDASLPWLVRDALVHHLSPRGLEQYTGGAWGTRDVTQGPLELLLALDRLPDARALVLQVFGAQNRDGSWPQAFGFLPGDEGFRHEPPHGDVVHWPVLALGEYLLASGDGGVLAEPVRWWTPDGDGPTTPMLQHVLAALDHARAGMLPGTHLVAYGHGDWNDSLQPADPAMARTMTSAWTVTLHHQALTTLAAGLDAVGSSEHAALAAVLRAEATAVAADLRAHLLVDGELAGYAQLAEAADGTPPRVVRYLVHPRDDETGLRRGSLQTIHALVGGLLAPDEAAHHVRLVREHLMGADGVRLFDAPPRYHGGATRHFQRAETATFVGREIGLMYVHAHLRWCEAMALLGDGEALWQGLRQVLPAAVGTAPDVVPGARPRQANTYASSSDAAVADRAEFAARYADVLTGATGLEGGWRIYSSGPGVLVRVVSQCLLGVRRRGDAVEIDPVLPRRLDGLTAVVPLAGGLLRLRYRVGERGSGVVAVRLGGEALRAPVAVNAYRPAGVVVALADLTAALSPEGPELEVELQ